MSTPDTVAADQVTHLDDSGTIVTTALNGAAIGPISLDYYLPIFRLFDASNRSGPSWNWAACLYTLSWLVFRRLRGSAWIYASAVLCCLLILFALSKWVPDFYDANEVFLWVGFGVFYFLLPGIYGNKLLYGATRENVLHALTVSSTLKGACEKLRLQAASRGRFIWLVLINMVLASSVAGVYLAFPDIAVVAKRAMFADEMDKHNEALVEESVQIPAAAPASVPTTGPLTASASALAPILVVSTLIPVASASPELMRPETESLSTSATQADLTVLDAAALRYVPRRRLDVIATSAAPVEAAPAGSRQTVTASTQANPLYYINVGLFANDWNARYAQAKLVDAGLVSFRQALMTNKGKLTRVRVGPFESKADADVDAKKIHALKLDAVVIRQ
ncbi:SPOR domain-containing protein [Rhodoferax sp.]|uniref:SPOR domain-containing protein n=1 Tax=Rhodoferax sp. TaxID=50421 RepID=UPI00260C8727|nr:SPOR domain-containing protein [Rhodoferax sp.]